MSEIHVEPCATRAWYPHIECQGTPYLLQWGNGILGRRWACLEHAVHAVRQVPDAVITDAPDPTFAEEVRSRALLPRNG